MSDVGVKFGPRLIAIPVLLAAALAGCGTPNIQRDYTPSEATGKGVVVGTLDNCSSDAVCHLYYRKVGSGTSGYFRMIRSGEKPTVLFAAELSAGECEFFDWRAYGGGCTTDPGHTFSAPFSVVSGKAVYAGSFALAACGLDIANKGTRDLMLLGELGYSHLTDIRVDVHEEVAPYFEVAKNACVDPSVFYSLSP